MISTEQLRLRVGARTLVDALDWRVDAGSAGA